MRIAGSLLAPTAFVALAVVLRIPVFDDLIDPDTAAYMTIDGLVPDGLLPYRDFFDHKQPFVHVVHAGLQWIDPGGLAIVRLAAALAGGITGWVCFLGLREWVGATRAVAAAVLTIVVSASDLLEGATLNAEHVLAPLAAAAILGALNVRAGRRWECVAIGLLFGLAVMTKAVAIWMAPAVAVPMVLRAGRSSLVWAAAGFAVPVVAFVLAYAAIGELDEFWYGNVGFNRIYVRHQWNDRGLVLIPAALVANLAVTAVAAVGLLVAWLRYRRDAAGLLDVTLVLWLLGGAIGALTGGRGFEHYFLPLVAPACALLVLPIPRWEGAIRMMGVVLAGLVLAPFAVNLVARIGESPRATALRIYNKHIADSAQRAPLLAAELRRRAGPGDRVYVQGTSAAIYVDSGVRPASRYVYNLSPHAYDRARWERDTEADVCGTPPRWIVTQTESPTTPLPDCLERGYREVARVGPDAVLELTGR